MSALARCEPSMMSARCSLAHESLLVFLRLFADVAALGDYAAQQLGTVHMWINNAGAVTGLLDDTPVAEIAEAVGTNVLGSLLCCR